MALSFVLPWFPIILGVGVGGRLLGRARGLGFGFLSALFWVILVQASAGRALWDGTYPLIALLAGFIAIVAMGAWSGESAQRESSHHPSAEGGGTSRHSEPEALNQVSALVDQFDDWLALHRDDANPWPHWDEWIRSALYQTCKATHVRPFRLLSDGEDLLPLRETDTLDGEERKAARRGVVGHVLATGRTYLAQDQSQGSHVHKLNDEADDQTAWCFAISHGTQRLGVVIAEQLDIASEQNRALLRATERLIARFWCTLSDAIRSREVVGIDPVSGLQTREAFLQSAKATLGESYKQGEPVVVVVVALEGLRDLNDMGRWELADELVREVGTAIRRKIRMDDQAGRFDGSRFLLLLRRVDSQLASLIVTQIMSQLTSLCGDEERWSASVTVRCGIAGSGTENPELTTLISTALQECRRARLEGTQVACDLKRREPLEGRLEAGEPVG